MSKFQSYYNGENFKNFRRFHMNSDKSIWYIKIKDNPFKFMHAYNVFKFQTSFIKKKKSWFLTQNSIFLKIFRFEVLSQKGETKEMGSK